jgi:hypothetical protein
MAWGKIQDTKSRRELIDLMTNDDRYWKVNFELERDTIEFCQAESTLDKDRLIDWGKFVIALIHAACQLNKDRLDALLSTKCTLEEFIQE